MSFYRFILTFLKYSSVFLNFNGKINGLYSHGYYNFLKNLCIDNAGYEDISPDEETSFNNKQFNELLLKLEKDLKILKDDLGEDLIEHFKELEELKKTATFSIINIENVTSFIHTNIFALMIELPEAFSFKLLTIYECMLKCVGYFPKKAYREHLQLLLDLKTDETKDLLLLINDKRKK